MLKKNELIKYAKLKKGLDFLEANTPFNEKIKNPYDELAFNTTKQKVLQSKGLNKFSSYRFWLILISVFLLLTSIYLNQLVSTRIDLVMLPWIGQASFIPKPCKQFIFEQIKKPYVITLGHFSNFDTAKEKAIELLPRLKQIDIKQLPTGSYTLEIERFSSKEKAYVLLKQIKQDGFQGVNVRYLPIQ